MLLKIYEKCNCQHWSTSDALLGLEVLLMSCRIGNIKFWLNHLNKWCNNIIMTVNYLDNPDGFNLVTQIIRENVSSSYRKHWPATRGTYLGDAKSYDERNKLQLIIWNFKHFGVLIKFQKPSSLNSMIFFFHFQTRAKGDAPYAKCTLLEQ